VSAVLAAAGLGERGGVVHAVACHRHHPASAYAAGGVSLILGIAAGAVLPLLTGTLLR
jgi:hypothetical protein